MKSEKVKNDDTKEWETHMHVNQPLQLLGGMTPQLFMKRHWQKKPLVIRQAFPGFTPLLNRSELFTLAAQQEVQSRLLIQNAGRAKQGWQFKQGPFDRRELPALKRPGWSLLVQGVDLHRDSVHGLMNQFRFIPDGRLDDLMISYATDGGGVGPHFDSYDVFLLQAHGRRRWRIGRQKDLSLQEGMPLKILANFEPEEEFVLEPGDMLYLPPKYAHDGIALGECMTYSIGFRSPSRGEIAQELLQRIADQAQDTAGSTLYKDPRQEAVENPAEIPAGMLFFAQDALARALNDPLIMARALGEYLTEPKADVWFESMVASAPEHPGPLQLDRKTKMMFDASHIFINGESFLASGKDAKIMRQLANDRVLDGGAFDKLTAQAQELLLDWQDAGWIQWGAE